MLWPHCAWGAACLARQFCMVACQFLTWSAGRKAWSVAPAMAVYFRRRTWLCTHFKVFDELVLVPSNIPLADRRAFLATVGTALARRRMARKSSGKPRL